MRLVIFVCYNHAMPKSRQALLASLLVITSGCASTGDQTDVSAPGAPEITFAQVKAGPESFTGQSVTFGGKVLSARRLKEGTRIEILQLPLSSSSQPITDLSKSQGRFVALQKEFLDPATVPPGTFVNVTGEMAGSVTLPLDETEYTYPLVLINNLRVWAEEELEPPRIGRPFVPGPYWGPYWSPYWSPYHSWPYYW
jgi:outer membrane lipoprotein